MDLAAISQRFPWISSSHGFHRPGGHPTYSLDGEGGMLWAVSQAAPLRRGVVDHNLFLWYLRLPPAGVSSKDARRSENVEKKRAEFLGVVPGFWTNNKGMECQELVHTLTDSNDGIELPWAAFDSSYIQSEFGVAIYVA